VIPKLGNSFIEREYNKVLQQLLFWVAVKALSANISWTAEQICMIKLVLLSAHQYVYNDIWYVSKW